MKEILKTKNERLYEVSRICDSLIWLNDKFQPQPKVNTIKELLINYISLFTDDVELNDFINFRLGGNNEQ